MREDIVSFINEFAGSEPPFFIEMTGISYCDGTYRIVRKSSPFYVFEYILEGEGTVIIDGKHFTAKKVICISFKGKVIMNIFQTRRIPGLKSGLMQKVR